MQTVYTNVTTRCEITIIFRGLQFYTEKKYNGRRVVNPQAGIAFLTIKANSATGRRVRIV